MEKITWNAKSDKTFELCAKQVENADKVLAKYACRYVCVCVRWMWHTLSPISLCASFLYLAKSF